MGKCNIQSTLSKHVKEYYWQHHCQSIEVKRVPVVIKSPVFFKSLKLPIHKSSHKIITTGKKGNMETEYVVSCKLPVFHTLQMKPVPRSIPRQTASMQSWCQARAQWLRSGGTKKDGSSMHWCTKKKFRMIFNAKFKNLHVLCFGGIVIPAK